LEEALASLPEPEQVVIKLRFGFNDGQAYTQKEIADLLGVVVSTVVALDRRAQKRLRRVLCA
jgi:RNA polymerase sigma factor (sigma-70 family)